LGAFPEGGLEGLVRALGFSQQKRAKEAIVSGLKDAKNHPVPLTLSLWN
jgi:hypothetical protein